MSALRRLGVALLALLLALSILPTAWAQAPVVVAVSQVTSDGFPTVVANVTLVDATGRPILGQGPQSFEILEDNKPVASFKVGTAVDSKEPLNVALAIDVSGSMENRPILDAKAAANTFVQGLGPTDKAAIISFAEKATLVQPFTERKDELGRAIASLNAVGDTALYDAVVLSSRTFGKSGRRILVLLTDGEDTISKARLVDALSAMQAIQVPVFTVGVGPKVDRQTLDALAVGTGGVALYAPASADLATAYRNISDQLRNQYVLTFSSQVRPDNQRHSLVVRAKAGGAQAEARSTFVAVSVPPEVTIVAPKEGETVHGKVPVEVQAKGAGKIAKVEALAAGMPVGSSEQEPFTLQWDTSQLAGGHHTLTVTVTDSLGNRASKQVTVAVEPPAKPTPVPPTPTATPAARPPAPSNGNPESLIYGLLGLSAVLMMGLVVVRARRRQLVHKVPMRKVVPDKKCPTCGRPLKKGEACPVCRAEDDKIVRRRVLELGGLPPDDESQEDKP